MKKFVPLGVGVLLVVLSLGTYASTPQAHAQSCDPDNPVCTPACGTNQDCTYEGSGCTTACIAASQCDSSGNCTVSEVVVSPTPAAAPAAAPAVQTAVTPTATTQGGATFATLVANLVAIVNSTLIPLLYALAFLFFVWGIVQFVFIEGQEGRQKGRDKMIYGLIGLVVIFCVWGLVNIVLTTLQVG